MTFGTIDDVAVREYIIHRQPIPRQEGFGFVTFKDPRSVIAATADPTPVNVNGIFISCTVTHHTTLAARAKLGNGTMMPVAPPPPPSQATLSAMKASLESGQYPTPQMMDQPLNSNFHGGRMNHLQPPHIKTRLSMQQMSRPYQGSTNVSPQMYNAYHPEDTNPQFASRNLVHGSLYSFGDVSPAGHSTNSLSSGSQSSHSLNPHAGLSGRILFFLYDCI